MNNSLGVLGVRTLPLSPSTLSKLEAAGFYVCSDLAGIGPVALSREAGLSLEEAHACIKLATRGSDAGPGTLPEAVSARDLLDREHGRQSIFTFCAELDGLLGSGVAPGEVTEFCGPPGIGKTQLGIQLAVSVQIPDCMKGITGEAVYIDTEGSFMVDRVVEMADACVTHVRRIVSANPTPSAIAQATAFTRESVLSGIHYFRVQNATEQRAVLECLPAFIGQHPKVKLVVVDSVAFHFRQDFEDMYLRTRILGQMSGILMKLADTHGLAVVTMNQVTTKIGGPGASKQVPALGESYAHSCTTRVMLSWHMGERLATLYKSPRLPPGTAVYSIDSDGVRSLRTNKRSRLSA